MIRLETEEYCNECPEFEAEVEKVKYYTGLGHETCDTKIQCNSREKCQCLMEYLKDKK